ncbi:MAG: ABC transporter permease [Candidatus Krumholzibacteria bacterium]|jgi:putative ABC transport system permease protein|nr:ABC transporter permease [Candidatus Krumholzibacteria bacterium]MDP6797181.1 ABC transporter permease [Candidatus Krumholzibacteria bacterium]MDP7021474.1 ABC transporter permease [Candidatus Krumholzibacteria bacterium]
MSKIHGGRVLWAGLKENIRMALDTLRGNKGRSGLVILGVGIGVMTLMAMVSVIEGFKGSLESEIRDTESSYIYISNGDPFGNPHLQKNRNPLGLDDWYAIEDHCPSLQQSTIWGSFGTLVQGPGDKSALMEIDGTAPNCLDVIGFNLEEGRFLNSSDWAGRRDVCVIPRGPATSFFGLEDPIGKKLRVNLDTELTIVGIMEDRKSIFGAMANNYLFLPYTTMQKHFPWAARDMTSLMATPDGDDLLDKLNDEIELALRIHHKLAPGEKNDFQLSTQDMMLDFTKKFTGPLTLVGVILASIGLMVGGIGVITIMLVSVKERTREIGIRKAVGGRQRDILIQFLMESATLTGLGGTVGLIAGLLLGQILRLIFHVPATVPLLYVFVALLVSCGTGIFFGLYPAMQAARLDPVEALGYE